MEDVAPTRARWRAVALWAAAIFVASSVPGRAVPMPDAMLGVDKVVHALVYAVLGSLLVMTLPRRPGRVVLAVLLAAAYGVSDELHQVITPGRDASVWDWLADVVGAVLGATGRSVYDRARGRRSDPPAPGTGWEGARGP